MTGLQEAIWLTILIGIEVLWSMKLLSNKRQILWIEFDMTNEEMINSIREICGCNSISYYNIINCRHQSDVVCGIVYQAILNGELESVQEEINKLLEKKKAIINLLEDE